MADTESARVTGMVMAVYILTMDMAFHVEVGSIGHPGIWLTAFRKDAENVYQISRQNFN